MTLPLRDRAIDGGRQVLRASIFFLILFLFVRTFALEPFAVPTGSLATSFLGNHREIDCPRCGIAVVIGEPTLRERASLTDSCCPNCGQKHLNFTTARELPGDRLLVGKNVFNVRSPRRWEVAVFRCPVDDSKPYVKRVVGKPGEVIQLRDGDVYVNELIERKTLVETRECRVLVFDQNHAPPGGWAPRWRVQKLGEDEWKPATAEHLQNGAIHIADGLGVAYRNWDLDERQELPLKDRLAYNGSPRSRREQPVHDFIATFDLEIVSDSSVPGSFACRLFDGLDAVNVQLAIGDVGQTTLGRDGEEPAFSTDLRLAVGTTHAIEFAFVDRRANLAVDGKAIPPALDLPATLLDHRKGVSQPVQFGVSGASVIVRNFKLWRDVHLRAEGHGTSPYQLAADEYFVCGDNSNSSHDSREWAVPGVPEASLLGKPFLIHQPLRLGRVTVGGQEKTYQAIDWSRLKWVR